MFFIEKIHEIKMEFPLLYALPFLTHFSHFLVIFWPVLFINWTELPCGLDIFPTKLLMSHLSSIINIIIRIVNLCFSFGNFPASFKLAIISPLIKKQDLDSEILKNYRPVANLSFI